MFFSGSWVGHYWLGMVLLLKRKHADSTIPVGKEGRFFFLCRAIGSSLDIPIDNFSLGDSAIGSQKHHSGWGIILFPWSWLQKEERNPGSLVFRGPSPNHLGVICLPIWVGVGIGGGTHRFIFPGRVVGPGTRLPFCGVFKEAILEWTLSHKGWQVDCKTPWEADGQPRGKITAFYELHQVGTGAKIRF